MNMIGNEKCKMVATTRDKKGKPILEYTTWIDNDISVIINTVPIKFNVSAGEEMTIVVKSDKDRG